MTAATLVKVLVLDANQRSALAVVRSLGRQGIPLVTSDCTAKSLAGSSRYSLAYLRSPSPTTDPAGFIRWLEGTVREQGITYIQPVTEVSSQLILRHREALPATSVLPFAPLDTVMALADKGDLVELAGRAGVACPETRFLDNAAALDPDTVQHFPVVLKPRLSRIFLGDRWLSTAVAIVPDRETLTQTLLTRTEFRDHPFLLQTFIPGHGAGIFALYNHGQAQVFFAHQRLREKPPAGGVSVLSMAAEPLPAALDAAKRLLDHVGWHGVAMVEFRVDPDGKPYLMEVNTRFWGSLQLAVDAGVDFPWLLYQLNTRSPAPGTGEADTGRGSTGDDSKAADPISAYRVGQRLRWWLGDLDSLYLYLRDPGQSSGAKLKRALQFLVPRPFDTRHEVFRWHDPMPAWAELKAWLSALR